MNWSQGLFSKQYPFPDGASLPKRQSAWGGQKPSTSPRSLGHQAVHTGKVGVAEPFEQGCLQMQALSVLQVSSRMPPVGGDIPGDTDPFLPLSPFTSP